MFFQFEELPVFGKEYWFLYVSDAKTLNHLVVMFGRAQGTVNINRRRLKESHAASPKTEIPLVCEYWSYSGKKKRSKGFQSVFSVRNSPENALEDRSKRVSLTGKYPFYSFSIRENGQRIASISFSAPRSGKPYEIGHFSTSVFGFELVNVFPTFKGTLYGKPVSGHGYLQKVVAVGPFIPWNWARIHFPDGSILDVFSLRFVPSHSFGSISPSRSTFWDARTGRQRTLSGTSISRDADRSSWVIRDGKGRLLLHLYPKAKHRFLFKSTGEFLYDQYAVDAYPEEGGIALAGRTLKKGAGLLEDAYGFML